MKLKLKRSNSLDFIPHKNSEFRKVGFSILQIVLFILLISIAFVVSSSGFYVKPLLFIPISICFAVFLEDELQSAIVGMVCGLLFDISYNKLLGFNGALLLMMCVFTTLMFKNYFKPMFFNALIYVTTFTFLHSLLDYFFYYKIWALNSNDDVSIIYDSYILPSCIMTVVSVIVIYPIVKGIKVNLN